MRRPTSCLGRDAQVRYWHRPGLQIGSHAQSLEFQDVPLGHLCGGTQTQELDSHASPVPQVPHCSVSPQPSWIDPHVAPCAAHVVGWQTVLPKKKWLPQLLPGVAVVDSV